MGKPNGAPADGARAPAARRTKRSKITPSQRREGNEGTVNKHWRTFFLQKLAETSNIKASADYAEIASSRAYKARREEPDFAADWRAALLEGYEHLEMEVLGYLRNADPEHKMDVGAALKLLAAHSHAVARERALADNRDEQEVLDSIDAMIDAMRERAAANAAVIAENAVDDADG
ncbi:MAG: hypothetical protein B7Z08_07925 [Sphingomonadales bacterium 32-68-7]|nr:MAG: hypothetical protein B7Z33_09930 [Sphingomonadales bacterium 12-68-11]OYX08797.1 MAG: hypothetical protein B7Z08_07925 [Sphingomonadales bacterium 32-68-7]